MKKNNTLNMNSTVKYLSTSDSVITSNYTLNWDYWKTWPEVIQPYYTYPTYITSTKYEDTYKKAFTIAKLLLKKNLLVSRKLKDFIGLVEEIAKEL